MVGERDRAAKVVEPGTCCDSQHGTYCPYLRLTQSQMQTGKERWVLR